jgi:EmrB/QacA subfamily drug resistance transporter
MDPEGEEGKSQAGTGLAQTKSSAPHGLLILILLTMAQFLIVLDYTIVTVALPSMIRELGITITLAQWVVTAYGLTLAGFLLLSGRAGDAYGHKRLFIAGLVVFSLASLASGLAPSIGILIAARAVQGVGAAMGSATGLSILVATFPEGPQRNRALGIFGGVIGTGFVMGMISGGIITTYLGWRWVFDVTVPIGLAAAAVSAKVIRPVRVTGSGKSLDFPGAITVTGGLMLLVYALTGIQSERSVSVQTAGMLALSALILAGFVVIEGRTAKPLLPLGFLRRRLVFTANMVALLTLAAFVGEIFLLTIYLQQILDYSPLEAGLAFAPSGLVFFGTATFVAARFINRAGVRIALVIGEGLSLVGYLLATQVSAAGNYISVVLPSTVAVAFGLGLAFPAYSVAALMGAKRGEEGLASGLINTSRQIGGPIGVAALTTVATLLDPPGSGPQALAGVVTGLDFAFLAAGVFAAVAVLLSYSIKHNRRVVSVQPVEVSPAS